MTTLSYVLRPVALALLSAGLTLTVLAAPPVAPVRDVPEVMHGVTVHDPYRYMENVKDPQVRSWLDAQGAHARQSLDHIEGRKELEKRIAEISRSSGDSVRDIVRMPGDHIFYQKRGRGEKLFTDSGQSDRFTHAFAPVKLPRSGQAFRNIGERIPARVETAHCPLGH